MTGASGELRSPLQSKWIELRDEVRHRIYLADLHGAALQALIEPIPRPDGSNPHADRRQRTWLAPPPVEPECMRPYPCARLIGARARGLQPTSDTEASAWLEFDHTTPDAVFNVISHYRDRMPQLGLRLTEDGWLHHPDQTHRLVAESEDQTEQFEIFVNNFGPTTLIHSRYTVFTAGHYQYEPPPLIDLHIDHYDEECEILYLHHPADNQYFALSRYLIELCSQDETSAIGAELATSIRLPEWLPAYPGERPTIRRGLMPVTHARYVDLQVKTDAPMEAVLDFYRRVARHNDLEILGESEAEGRRSLLANDRQSRFRFEVVTLAQATLTEVNLNYWEYPAAEPLVN